MLNQQNLAAAWKIQEQAINNLKPVVKHKPVILVVGPTGAGKGTLVNYLRGIPFEDSQQAKGQSGYIDPDDRLYGCIQPKKDGLHTAACDDATEPAANVPVEEEEDEKSMDLPYEERATVGDSLIDSCTEVAKGYPYRRKFYVDGKTTIHDVVLVDCLGTGDSRGREKRICIDLGINAGFTCIDLLQNIYCVLPESAMCTNRGEAFKGILRVLIKLGIDETIKLKELRQRAKLIITKTSLVPSKATHILAQIGAAMIKSANKEYQQLASILIDFSSKGILTVPRQVLLDDNEEIRNAFWNHTLNFSPIECPNLTYNPFPEDCELLGYCRATHLDNGRESLGFIQCQQDVGSRIKEKQAELAALDTDTLETYKTIYEQYAGTYGSSLCDDVTSYYKTEYNSLPYEATDFFGGTWCLGYHNKSEGILRATHDLHRRHASGVRILCKKREMYKSKIKATQLYLAALVQPEVNKEQRAKQLRNTLLEQQEVYKLYRKHA